jgi:hypothetical protein
LVPTSNPEPVPEIQGDVLLDRLTGWSILVLAVAVVIFSLTIPHKTTEGPLTLSLMFSHYRLLVLTVIGGIAVSRSSLRGFQVALAMFGLRVLVDTIELGTHHGDRFISSSWMFDAMMVAYVIFRLRSYKNRSQ